MITSRGGTDLDASWPVAIRRSTFARALVLTAVLAAMGLGMSTGALARPAGDDAVQELLRRGERASHDTVGTIEAQELFRRGERALQDQAGPGMPAKATVPVPPVEPSRQLSWRIPALGVLTGALALLGGLTLLVARRMSAKTRPLQAA